MEEDKKKYILILWTPLRRITTLERHGTMEEIQSVAKKIHEIDYVQIETINGFINIPEEVLKHTLIEVKFIEDEKQR